MQIFNPGNLGTVFPPTSNLSMGGYRITNLGTPVAGTDAANKAYVDAFVSGLTPLTACRVATTAALTVTYSNGTAGVGATLTNAGAQAAISIDGVSLSVGNRVLVKDQASQLQNGVYTVTTVGSGSVNWVLTRATDFNSSSNILEGSFTNITAGTANAGEVWIETGSGPFTVGTTAIVFTLFGNFGTMATQNASAVAITGGTISGVELNNYSETTQSVAAASTTTVDYSAGGIVLLSQNTAITTFNITNPSATGKACKVVIIRTKDATGTARAITWPSGTIWPNGVAPTLSSTTGAVDIFTLLTTDAGTTWYGFVGGQAFA